MYIKKVSKDGFTSLYQIKGDFSFIVRTELNKKNFEERVCRSFLMIKQGITDTSNIKAAFKDDEHIFCIKDDQNLADVVIVDDNGVIMVGGVLYTTCV